MEKLDFTKEDRPNIPISLVKRLVNEQFPEYGHLRLVKVVPGGWDNRTFRLGDQLVVRMPSAERYASQVQKEQDWLPVLAHSLDVAIPKPVAHGSPTKDYPYPWSIYEWIKADTADKLKADAFDQFAKDAAGFLSSLQQVESAGAPLAGPPFYRGCPLKIYDSEAYEAISTLDGVIDGQIAMEIWGEAMSSEWTERPVWFHGDFSPQNILIKDNRLIGVIDFGLSAVGDPACDLVIAWTMLDRASAEIFKRAMNLGLATWARARGWALWKAMKTLAKTADKSSNDAMRQRMIIGRVFNDHIKSRECSFGAEGNS
jgi:aminoglycoside phosphotransferase (APT) family kinase protein